MTKESSPLLAINATTKDCVHSIAWSADQIKGLVLYFDIADFGGTSGCEQYLLREQPVS
jgi:hypothetical protein